MNSMLKLNVTLYSSNSPTFDNPSLLSKILVVLPSSSPTSSLPTTITESFQSIYKNDEISTQMIIKNKDGYLVPFMMTVGDCFENGEVVDCIVYVPSRKRVKLDNQRGNGYHVVNGSGSVRSRSRKDKGGRKVGANGFSNGMNGKEVEKAKIGEEKDDNEESDDEMMVDGVHDEPAPVDPAEKDGTGVDEESSSEEETQKVLADEAEPAEIVNPAVDEESSSEEESEEEDSVEAEVAKEIPVEVVKPADEEDTSSDGESDEEELVEPTVAVKEKEVEEGNDEEESSSEEESDEDEAPAGDVNETIEVRKPAEDSSEEDSDEEEEQVPTVKDKDKPDAEEKPADSEESSSEEESDKDEILPPASQIIQTKVSPETKVEDKRMEEDESSEDEESVTQPKSASKDENSKEESDEEVEVELPDIPKPPEDEEESEKEEVPDKVIQDTVPDESSEDELLPEKEEVKVVVEKAKETVELPKTRGKKDPKSKSQEVKPAAKGPKGKAGPSKVTEPIVLVPPTQPKTRRGRKGSQEISKKENIIPSSQTLLENPPQHPPKPQDLIPQSQLKLKSALKQSAEPRSSQRLIQKKLRNDRDDSETVSTEGPAVEEVWIADKKNQKRTKSNLSKNADHDGDTSSEIPMTLDEIQAAQTQPTQEFKLSQSFFKDGWDPMSQSTPEVSKLHNKGLFQSQNESQASISTTQSFVDPLKDKLKLKPMGSNYKGKRNFQRLSNISASSQSRPVAQTPAAEESESDASSASISYSSSDEDKVRLVGKKKRRRSMLSEMAKDLKNNKRSQSMQSSQI